ncbi:hypothetical protein OS493_023942 [Desmophyllum pertusum]|uniref:G-protein coupled receptors family 1 profile domain-containing protein n=1 Tax=Desmophyllum pertusum TaxID=174260 RepID=A0A9X0CE40_9CNID|nr:hypothetical protein OS493_023942 [Desmophyllum pertusum]
MDSKLDFSSCSNATKNITQPAQGNGHNQMQTNYTEIAKLISIAAAIVIVNSLVFCLYLKKKTLRTSSNYPLFSLAVCDFFAGFAIIPLFAILSFTPLIQSQGTRFYLGFLVTVLHNFVAFATVYHIVVLTGERYLAIKFPLKHRVLDQKSVEVVLSVVWISSLLVSFVPFTWINQIYPVWQPVSLKFTLGFAIFCLVFALVLPYIFLIYAFIDMFKGVYGGTRSGRRQKSSGFLRRTQSTRRQFAGERKCLAMFAIMASTFLICWLPWFVIFLLHQLPYDQSKMKVPAEVALLIRYMTSVVNPLLYTFLKRDFYQALKFVFNRRRQVSISLTYYSRRGTAQTDCNHLPAVSRGQQTSPEAALHVIEECESEF